MLMRLTIIMADYRVSGYYDNADDLEAALDPLAYEGVPIGEIMRHLTSKYGQYYTHKGYTLRGVPVIGVKIQRVDVNAPWEGLQYESA